MPLQEDAEYLSTSSAKLVAAMKLCLAAMIALAGEAVVELLLVFGSALKARQLMSLK